MAFSVIANTSTGFAVTLPVPDWPLVGSVGSLLTGADSTSVPVPVPSGVAADDIILAFVVCNYSDTIPTITGPAGFTAAPNSPGATSSGYGKAGIHVWWKRATGSDTGTYDFTLGTSCYRIAQAVRYTGCIASGNPIDVDTSASQVYNATTAMPPVSATTTVANTRLVWAAGTWNNYTLSTPPSGFTVDATNGNPTSNNAGCFLCSLGQAAAGSTGTLTAAQSDTATGDRGVWLGALKPAIPPIVGVVAASSNEGVGNRTVTKPAGTLDGDLLIAFHSTNWDTSSVLTATGWTQVATVNNGTNKVSGKVWAKVAASEPASWTFGANAGDTVAQVVAIRGYDTTIANLLSATSSTTAGSGSTRTAPSISSVPADSLLLCAISSDTNNVSSVTTTSPGDMTEVTDAQSTTWLVQSAATMVKTTDSSTPTGTKTFTRSVSGSSGLGDIGFSVAVLPVGGAPSGTASGTYSFAGSAGGTKTPKGTGSGTYTWAGSSAGKKTQKGTGAGTYTWAGSASGTKAPKGTGSGTYTWAGSASGAKTSKATASGAYTWTSAGSVTIVGTSQKSETASAGGNAWITANKPTGTIDGDVMVAFCSTDGSGSYAGTTAPAGWDLLTGNDSGTGVVLKVFTRVASSEGSTYDFTFTGDDPDASVVITSLRNVDTSTAHWLKDITWTNTNSTSRVAPSLSGTGAALLCSANVSAGNVAITFTKPSGMTTKEADTHTNYVAETVASLLNPSNPTGTQTFTASASPQRGYQSSVLIPAGYVGPSGARASKATASGAYAWAGSATGERPAASIPQGTGSGAYTFAGTASGAKTSKATASGTYTWAGSATGDCPPNRGTAGGTYTWAGNASGTKAPKGTAAGGYSWAGQAIAAPPNASASGTYTWSGSASGSRTPKAAAGGGYTWAATASGVKTQKGTGTGTYTWTGSATGDCPPNAGTVSATYTWSGSASGSRTPKATASGGYTWAGSAGGSRTPKATASGGYTWAATDSGKRTPKATASGGYTWAGSATGVDYPLGTGSGTYTWGGQASGSAPIVGVKSGTGYGTYLFAGSASGARDSSGTASGGYTWAATDSGSTTKSGTGSGTYTWTGSATGSKPTLLPRTGTAGGAYAFGSSQTGSKTSKATTSGGYTWTSGAVGSRHLAGSAAGTYGWAGTAVGASVAGSMAYGGYGWSGSGAGQRNPASSATGEFTWVAAGTGYRHPKASVYGTYRWHASLVPPSIERTSVIAAENRTWVVPYDGRSVSIAENRFSTVPFEDRGSSPPTENREVIA